MMNTPILFVIFNRPETTRRVFNVIKEARPKQLYIAADGPRDTIAGEKERCEGARSVIDLVDWSCDVRTLFRDRNLGCKKAVSSGIDWFFNDVDEGIILEDDCLPDPSFFNFCEEMLGLYRTDTRVMQICGSNFLSGWKRHDYSYYFSSYGPIWGWASWRRAWKYYDVDMKLWPVVKQEGSCEDFCLNSAEVDYRKVLYDRLYAGEIDTWDYQWGFSKMVNSGLSITPNVNLVSNIGFGSDATHTSVSSQNPFAGMSVSKMIFPLKHPAYVLRDRISDMLYFDKFVLGK